MFSIFFLSWKWLIRWEFITSHGTFPEHFNTKYHWRCWERSCWLILSWDILFHLLTTPKSLLAALVSPWGNKHCISKLRLSITDSSLSKHSKKSWPVETSILYHFSIWRKTCTQRRIITEQFCVGFLVCLFFPWMPPFSILHLILVWSLFAKSQRLPGITFK